MIYALGHKNPDTDSIIAAIAQAHRIGATPAAQSDPNPETQFVLDKFGLNAPKILTSVAGKNIFIVDTNDPAQLPDDIDQANIIGIVDHHQLVGKLKTPGPIEVTIRPYGCTCTIIAKRFMRRRIDIPQNLAGAMLCAILSDTVMFKSPTSTKSDREMAEMLALIADLDINEIGLEIMKIKSDISNETSNSLLNRDIKEFDINGKRFAIAQVELVNGKMIEPFVTELRHEMAELKHGKKLDGVIMIITDIMKDGSTLILETNDNKKIQSLFKALTKDESAFVPGLLSRKKQVIPVLTANL
ncbi:MAG: manganese-dependent inorganic pyrophosphatase [Alphaproteobacteria bacterium]|nr:manganese-dependent inorganic pyrophosphatase [Alphaproteobacteria bacterium]